jgi:transposase
MYCRRINHPNGTVYIQVVEKIQGRSKVLKSFGGSKSMDEVKHLEQQADIWIKQQRGLQEFDFTNYRDQVSEVLSNIRKERLVGIEFLLGSIFDEIGFNQIVDPIFRQLVLFRLVRPVSKLKTTDYLRRYLQKEWSEDQIYRYMDKLHSIHKTEVERISYEHTLKVLEGRLRVVFYDVTTLYFAIDQEDALRKTGFSKEGKHQNPQIVLGLLVSQGGYPLAYDLFEGNKFEGHTMLPVIDHFRDKYALDKLTIIADSGLMSNDNVEELIENNYDFVLGARIRNETYPIQKKILALELKNGQSAVIDKGALKLIINYSEKRAKKDVYNRSKGLKRLEKNLRRGKLNKSHINKRGYNKYLKLDGQIKVSIDYEKYKSDAKWDGLKGYLTNSDLPINELINNYKELWQIEKAFRITKSDIRIRPIYHRLPRRIEAHICITFVAYKLYKELERQLKIKKSHLSPTKAIEIAEYIHELEVFIPQANETITKTLLLTDEQKYLANLFNFPRDCPIFCV